MALASNALTTYETIKAELNAAGVAIVDGTHQALVERRINAVSDAAAQFCSRVFERAVITDEAHARPAGRQLVLKRTPIESIEAITLAGSALASTDYSIEDAAAGVVRLGSDAGSSDLGAVGSCALDLVPGSGELDLLVDYTAGYVTPAQAASDAATGAELDTRTGTGAGTVTGTAGAGATGALAVTVDTGGAPYDLDITWKGGTAYQVLGISLATLQAGIDLAAVDSALAGLTWTLTSPMGVSSLVESWDVTPTVLSTRTLPTDVEEAVIESVCASWRLRQAGFAADGAEKDGEGGLLTKRALAVLAKYRRWVL